MLIRSTFLQYLAVLFGVMSVSSCNQGWSESDKKAFIDNCMAAEIVNGRSEKQDRELCNCLFEKMASRYPQPKDTARITYQERISWNANCLGYE